MKKKKGFTLIELLAIIVILAIIAVITVPIILGMIEDASKNAAKSSAYGYINAVDKKYYTSQLESSEYERFNGKYTINSAGNLEKNSSTVEISVSGEKPSGGSLNYENGILKSGCLVINGYEAKYQNGEFTVNSKGDCTASSETCPGPTCVYAYYSDAHTAEGSLADTQDGVPTTLTNYTTDYLSLGKPSFLGHILEGQTIKKVYVCFIQSNQVFCIRGGVNESMDNYQEVYSQNVNILKESFPTITQEEENFISVTGNGLEGYVGNEDAYIAWTWGESPQWGYEHYAMCDANDYGYASCMEDY